MSYERIAGLLSAHSPAALSAALRQIQLGGLIHPRFAGDERPLSELRHLWFNTEVQRDLRNVVFSAMIHGLLQSGDIDIHEAMTLHPAAQQDAMSALRQTRAEYKGKDPLTVHEQLVLRDAARQRGETDLSDEAIAEIGASARQESRERQISLLKTWFARYVHGATDAATIPDLETYIYKWLQQYYGTVIRK